MSDIMDGPSLGICDVHPGVHQFRNDPSPCIGWMDYEPFVKPVKCSACGDSLDVRDADDKMRCEPCHDADVTHDEQGNQITPV